MTEINSLDAAPRRMTVLYARGSGKTLAMENWRRAHEEFERIMARTDQLHRLAAGWRIAPPQPPAAGIAGVRWACTAPTGQRDLPLPDMYRLLGIEPLEHQMARQQDILDIIIKAKEAARNGSSHRP